MKSSLLFVLLFPLFCRADVAGSSQIILSALEKIPNAQAKCVINKITEIVGLDKYEHGDASIHATNSGLNSHLNKEEKEDACLQDAEFQLYHRISELDGTHGNEKLRLWRDRPSLADSAGKGKYEQFKEGLLWDLALRYSQGSAKRAITALTTCGNDDVVGRSGSPRPSKQVAQDEIQYLSEKISEEQKTLSQTVDNEKTAKLMKSIGKYTDELNDLKDPEKKIISGGGCPQVNSVLYLPKIIGPDLPDDIKEKVIKIQAPKNGGSSIPAKSYHTITGAYLGCRLVECDISPELSSEIAGKIARAYRWIITKDKTHAEKELNLTEVQKKYQKQFGKDELPDWNDPEMYKWLKANDKKGTIYRNYPYTDATILYDKWFVGPYRVGGPDNLLDEDPYYKSLALGASRALKSFCDIPGWSNERCQEARKILATWEVDFERDEGATKAGAAWGAEQCLQEKKHPVAKNPACEAPVQNSSDRKGATK